MDEKPFRDAGNPAGEYGHWQRTDRIVYITYGFVARMSGDVPGASNLRTFLNPASSNQLLISLKLKVLPFSVFTSICTANMSARSGSVRWSFTSHSAIAMTPPDFRARRVFLSNLRLRSSPSLCKMWPSVAMSQPVPKSASSKSSSTHLKCRKHRPLRSGHSPPNIWGVVRRSSTFDRLILKSDLVTFTSTSHPMR